MCQRYCDAKYRPSRQFRKQWRRWLESGGARDDSPSWNLGLVKQGNTIRVDGPVHGVQGQEEMKDSESGCFRVQRAQGQAANESAGGRKTKESSEGPEDWTTERGREHHR